MTHALALNLLRCHLRTLTGHHRAATLALYRDCATDSAYRQWEAYREVVGEVRRMN